MFSGRSLKFTFILPVLLVFLIGMGMALRISVGSSAGNMQQERARHLRQTLDIVHASLRRAMASGNREQVRALVNDIGSAEGIEDISIADEKGVIRVTSTPRNQDEQLRSGASDALSGLDPDDTQAGMAHDPQSWVLSDPHGASRSLRMDISVPNEQSCSAAACHQHDPDRKSLGTLSITCSLAELDALVTRQRTRTIIIHSAVSFGVIAIIALLFHVRVGRRITRMTACMSRLEQGDLTAVSLQPAHDELGRLERGLCTLAAGLADYRASMEHQVSQADKLASLGELISGVAHELRGPLAGISIAVQTFKAEMAADDHRREIFNEVLAEVDRLNGMVQDFLRYAKPTPPDRRAVDVNALVERSMILFRKQLKDQQLDLRLTLAENLPSVVVDPDQVRQVLIGIVLNAADATPRGGAISIITAPAPQSGAFVAITVSDTGKGMPQENLARVCDPFFTTKAHGTGLGLAIARRIMEAHGGTMQITSTLGKGTSVMLLLPTGGTPGAKS